MMLCDWVEALATQATSPVINLAQQAFAPSWRDVFGSSGERLVSYALRSLESGQREGGVGICNLGSHTLARIKPMVTWSGSEYSRAPAGPLAIADNVVVMCAPLAENWPLATAFMVQSGGAACFLASSVNLGVLQLTSQREYYVPMLWTGAGRINQWGVRVSSAVAGTAVKAAVYQVNTDGGPGPQLFAFDNIAPPTATGFRTIVQSAGVAVPPGWLYLGLVTSGTPTLSIMATPACGPAPGIGHFFASGNYGTGMPATPAGLTAASSGRPTVLMRVAN